MFTGYGCSPLMVEGVLRRAAAAAMAEVSAVASGDVGVRLDAAAAASASVASDPAATIARLAAESDAMLHRLVAHFVATRWPTAVALNKADAPTAAARILECRSRFPHRVMVPTSARAELAALALCEREGRRWPPGCRKEHAFAAVPTAMPGGIEAVSVGGAVAPSAEALPTLLPVPLPSAAPSATACAPDATPAAAASTAGSATDLASVWRMAQQWGSTGVLDVLSGCVALRPPSLCFPVAHLGTLAPLGGPAVGMAEGGGGGGGGGGGSGGVDAPCRSPLRDCLQMRPLSTIGDVFIAAKRTHPPLCAAPSCRAAPASSPPCNRAHG